ncbi:MAG: DUF4870 domain-containing protein [Candidatus Omnitrophota bacterium]|nr:MAG: DUF4870 domain-containing protein [Candidatus Omnitrophota bacterium]
MEQKDLGKTSTGMQANLAALLCYLPGVGLIISIIFYIIEKENKFVRFNAMQSILLTVAIFLCGIVLGFIPLLNLIIPLIWLASLILAIILMVKSWQGEQLKLPLIGEIAEKNS